MLRFEYYSTIPHSVSSLIFELSFTSSPEALPSVSLPPSPPPHIPLPVPLHTSPSQSPSTHPPLSPPPIILLPVPLSSFPPFNHPPHTPSPPSAFLSFNIFGLSSALGEGDPLASQDNWTSTSLPPPSLLFLLSYPHLAIFFYFLFFAFLRIHDFCEGHHSEEKSEGMEISRWPGREVIGGFSQGFVVFFNLSIFFLFWGGRRLDGGGGL